MQNSSSCQYESLREAIDRIWDSRRPPEQEHYYGPVLRHGGIRINEPDAGIFPAEIEGE